MLAPVNGSEVFKQERLVKPRIMDEYGAEGGRARLGIGADQIVPKCRVQ